MKLGMSGLLALIVVVFLSCIATDVSAVSSDSNIASLHAYLQNEALALSESQQQISSFLISKNIPIKSLHLSREERRRRQLEAEKSKSRICMSTEENEVECRISLDRIDVGRKAIAPCGCVGSQRWIQFSEFNRLRRKEPSKWVTCQTCQQKFDYSIISEQPVDVKTALLSTMLDKPVIVRSILAVSVIVASLVLSADKAFLRLLTSTFFWQRVSAPLCPVTIHLYDSGSTAFTPVSCY
jgi:hypothetical protein